ncbi:glycosyltransferase family 2 protein [Selenomonas ruminantium]|uniref:Glycosyl transferase family 2 n=1 Tax=Selenomonas ruminantium TaxID=971 RepID=A0A1H0NYB1_SELRU|nr:glycosyltransferase family 2 protein [Selenomonas ruminantium]SDO97526.1 Glycosyl transferase family 2 [Selenomonas ruminantium]
MEVSNEYKYKITIITATYNSAITLEQTVASVAQQDYPNIEYIIVDGKSIDGTLDIIRKYEDKINLKWISEPDKGIYDAFNKGVDMATGDYIYFLGSDDALCNAHIISDIVAHIEADTDVLSAAIIVVDEKSKKCYPTYNHHALNKEKYIGGPIPHQGMFVRTSVVKKYKFDSSYTIAADYKFFLQCYYNDVVKFKFIDEPVAFFANNGTSSNLEECFKENNRIYNELQVPFQNSIVFNLKKYMKIVLLNIHLLPWFTRLKRQRKIKSLKTKHTCDNKICRWCGRL